MELNAGRVYSHTVRDAEGGQQLIDLLAATYRHSTRDTWAEHCATGRIYVHGAEAQADTLVAVGDLVEYHRPPWREPDAPTELEVLHADGDLLVLRKPSGLPVLPSEMYWERTVLAQLRRRFPPEALPSPVHRLGVGTSGVLLCAITQRAKAALGRALQERRVSKTYRALVAGLVKADAFEVKVPIGPVPHSSWGGSVHGAVPNGGGGSKHAHSIVRVLRRDTALCETLVEVDIPTGRAHQIRIHMAFAGHPLVGDPLYITGGLPSDAPADQREVRQTWCREAR